MNRSMIVILLAAAMSGCVAPSPTPPPIPPSITPLPTQTSTPAATAARPTAISVLPAGAGSALLMGYPPSNNELRRVDLATGQPSPGTQPLDIGEYTISALSPDGSRLALFRYPRSQKPDKGVFQLVDTRTLHARTIDGISFPQLASTLFFSPDGSRLLVTFLNTETGAPDSPLTGFGLALIDLEQGAVIAQAPLDFSPDTLRFSPDGRSIQIYGVRYAMNGSAEPSVPHVALFDAADLHTIWTAPVDGLRAGWYPSESTPALDPYEGIQWNPAPVFSSDGAKLYLFHADTDRLTTVDFSQKTIRSVAVTPQQSFLDSLMGFGAGIAQAKAIRGATLSGVLAGDGRMLAVVGTKMDFTVDSANGLQTSSTPLDLRIVDAASGALLHTIDSQATQIAASGDGRRLFLYSYDRLGLPDTEILDSGTFARISLIQGWQVYPAVFPLSGGRQALLAIRLGVDGSTALGVLDAQSFDQLTTWDERDSWGWVFPDP